MVQAEPLTIESGVAMPAPLTHAAANRRRPKLALPFADMAVGDSFCVPYDRDQFETIIQLQNRISSAASSWPARHHSDRRFATRCVGDSVRCWRVI